MKHFLLTTIAAVVLAQPPSLIRFTSYAFEIESCAVSEFDRMQTVLGLSTTKPIENQSTKLKDI